MNPCGSFELSHIEANDFHFLCCQTNLALNIIRALNMIQALDTIRAPDTIQALDMMRLLDTNFQLAAGVPIISF